MCVNKIQEIVWTACIQRKSWTALNFYVERISSLGDHPNLPMIFGVVTKSLPFCLVTQFHGVKETSLTLHQAANTNMLTPTSCISIFKKICVALSQVHLKGYLHNDLKANNVVLERARVSDDFQPSCHRFREKRDCIFSSGLRECQWPRTQHEALFGSRG